MLNRNSRTKKISIIAAVLLAAFTVIVYSRMAGQSPAPETANEAAPVQTQSHSGDAPSSALPTVADSKTINAKKSPVMPERGRHTTKSGAKTDFDLSDGDIGYVDVNSLLQDGNPYSLVALLKKHKSLTGASESLEIEIESTGETHWGYAADFAQVIGGVPVLQARGSVGFHVNGAVHFLHGILVDPQAAVAGNIKILRAEAETIALEAAGRYLEPYRAPYAERGDSLRMTAYPAEMHYRLDEANELRAEWTVGVATANPPESLEVLVRAETGRVLNVRSEIVEAAAAKTCTELDFRVCDGSVVGSDQQKWSCNGGIYATTTPVLEGNDCVAPEGQKEKCSQADYTTPRKSALDARDYVKKRGSQYLKGVGGADCRIDILVNVRKGDFPEGNQDAAAIYSESADAILIRDVIADRSGQAVYPALQEVVTAHELFHAVSVGSGDVEHGLVYSMDALYKEGADSEWNGPDGSLSTDQVIYRGDVLEVVGNAMYRIFKRMGVKQKDEVFRFALEVDRRKAASLAGFRVALVGVARRFPDTFQQAVSAVLVEMGINDTPPGTVSMSTLEFIEAKMRALAKRLTGEDAAWASAAAAEVRKEIYRRFGLDDDEPLRSPSGGNDGGGS